MNRLWVVVVLLLMSACGHRPETDAELKADAEHAVERRLDASASFSLEETVASQNIACGHAAGSGPDQRKFDADFAYRDGKLIMDTDLGFDQAAVACDLAAGGGNASDAANIIN